MRPAPKCGEATAGTHGRAPRREFFRARGGRRPPRRVSEVRRRELRPTAPRERRSARPSRSRIVDDGREAFDPRILDSELFLERLEGTQVAPVAELHAEHVKGNGTPRSRGGIGREDEPRLLVDETTDEPGARDSIDTRTRTGHPDTPAVFLRAQGPVARGPDTSLESRASIDPEEPPRALVRRSRKSPPPRCPPGGARNPPCADAPRGRLDAVGLAASRRPGGSAGSPGRAFHSSPHESSGTPGRSPRRSGRPRCPPRRRSPLLPRPRFPL